MLILAQLTTINRNISHFRFVFLIPAESGEKITLGISTMLNMTVFLMTVMQVSRLN